MVAGQLDQEIPTSRGYLEAQEHTISRTTTAAGDTVTAATGIPAVIEAAGPYVVGLAAIIVAAVLHDIHALELIGGGVAGGATVYGFRKRRGRTSSL